MAEAPTSFPLTVLLTRLTETPLPSIAEPGPRLPCTVLCSSVIDPALQMADPVGALPRVIVTFFSHTLSTETMTRC